MKNKISIVIPIYNVSKYLRRCLDSVKNQIYANIEVIMVNDGSTDGSELIAQQFVEDDDRFQLVHQTNGGLSAARNTGLQYATGDYIFYLDSDDYLADHCIGTLVEAAERYQADVVQANFYYDYPGYLLYDNCLEGREVCYNREEAMVKLLEQKEIKNFAWGQLIRSDIAKQYTFPMGKYYEDTFWKYLIVHACTKYVIVGKPMLYYLQRGDGISGSFSVRNLDQLEGEASRLDFLQMYYSNVLYKRGCSLFFKKIIIHKRRVLKMKCMEDRAIYLKRIEIFVKRYNLLNINSILTLQYKTRLFDKLIVDIERVRSRIMPSKKWKKLPKHD